MQFLSLRRLSIAVAIYLLLFAASFVHEWRHTPAEDGMRDYGETQQSASSEKKNYASNRQGVVAPSSIEGVQKYEKIATLTQRTRAFDSDRQRVEATIAAHQGIVQTENGSGLSARRVLYLGIGVPPDKFDAFVEALRAIGATAMVTKVKNDKTNEYLQLRAKRATLEKTRASLEKLKGSGGSIDERIHVQNELQQVEQSIQELGVSLGDFDSQNELCTVKLTLEERSPPPPRDILRVVLSAFFWASSIYFGAGLGFLAFTAGFWLVVTLVAKAKKLAAVS